MAGFFASKLLRWITVPYRSRLFTMASSPSTRWPIGCSAPFLQDIGELFAGPEDGGGFVARSREVEALLTDPRDVRRS